jgi:hypothetical protein
MGVVLAKAIGTLAAGVAGARGTIEVPILFVLFSPDDAAVETPAIPGEVPTRPTSQHPVVVRELNYNPVIRLIHL